MNSKKGTKEKNGSGRYTEVICDRIRSVYGCEGNSVTCKEKDDRTILSFMGVFVCINDSFRCTFKSISDEALCQYTRTDSDYNNCVRCSVGIMVYQYAGFYHQELAMQVSLLNNDCEKILRELEKLKREK